MDSSMWTGSGLGAHSSIAEYLKALEQRVPMVDKETWTFSVPKDLKVKMWVSVNAQPLPVFNRNWTVTSSSDTSDGAASCQNIPSPGNEIASNERGR